MQFPPNVPSEIVIPSSVPFLPGNDVIGIGFEVPPELAAVGINAAMIFYNSAWSPASTLPRVKYSFIGQAVTPDPDYSVGVITGFGWQVNPSTNTPVIVVAALITGMAAPTSSGYTFLETAIGVQNHNANDVFAIGEDGTTSGNGQVVVANNADSHTAFKTVGSGTPSTSWSVT